MKEFMHYFSNILQSKSLIQSLLQVNLENSKLHE